jgi:hypothetical protein
MEPPPAIPIDEGGDELAQPPQQRIAGRIDRKIIKRELTIFDIFNHNRPDGQRELIS